MKNKKMKKREKKEKRKKIREVKIKDKKQELGIYSKNVTKATK